LIEDMRAQARQQVQNDAAAQEHQELLAQHQQSQQGAILEQVFRTQVNGKIAVRNQANLNIILSWLHPGEQISAAWFRTVLSENPQLASQLGWQEVVDPKAQAASNKQQLEADRIEFEDFAKQSELYSINEANWTLLRSTLGPGLDKLSIAVVQLPEGPCVLTEDGETHQLIPATPAELAQWAQERFEADQENLSRMSANNDIEALRARARRDRERATPAVEQLEFQLSKGFEKEVLQGRSITPLPQTWLGKPLDAAFIRALNRHDPNTRILIERFGNCRLTARLHGVKTVRRFDNVGNPISGEYVFEN